MSLESYATVLTQDAALLRDCYAAEAFMADPECNTMLQTLLAGLSFTITFDLQVC